MILLILIDLHLWVPVSRCVDIYLSQLVLVSRCAALCTPSLYQSVNIILLSGQFPSLTTRSLDTGIVSPQQQHLHFRHTGTLPTTHHISSLSAQSFLGLLYLNAQCYYFLGWLLKQVIWVICVTQFREDRDKFKIYPKKMYISRPV